MPEKEGAAEGRPRVVIVGAGFAGLSVAKALAGTAAEVTVVDRRNHHLFQPLLYQVASAVLSPAEIAQPIRHLVGGANNVEVMLGEVREVDSARRVVRTADRELPYDILVLATGSSHSYFGNDDWACHAPGLKTLRDAVWIRSSVLKSFEAAETSEDPEERRRLMTIAVVGGGPTGVEVAGTMAELSRKVLRREFHHIDPEETRILLYEAGPRILPSFPETLAAYAERALGELGVEVATGKAVTAVEERGLRFADDVLPCANVVWAAGVAASPVARWLGIAGDRAGRVPVDPDLRVPGMGEVYVLGDAAAFEGPDGLLPGLAQVAQQQGRHLGRVLRARLAGREVEAGFRYRHRGDLATIGRYRAVAVVGGRNVRGLPAWLFWAVVHVYLLVGFRMRFLVTMEWAMAYLTNNRGARLITELMPPGAVGDGR